jgi:hypothetical protein
MPDPDGHPQSDNANVRPSTSIDANIINNAQIYTVNWWLSDIATNFITFTFVGATWGAFNPFPIAGSNRTFPVPPFSSLSSIGRCAGVCGGIAAINRFAVGGLAVARNRQDYWNDFFGAGVVYFYSWELFNRSNVANANHQVARRMCWHNRAVVGMTLGSILYANTGSGMS